MTCNEPKNTTTSKATGGISKKKSVKRKEEEIAVVPKRTRRIYKYIHIISIHEASIMQDKELVMVHGTIAVHTLYTYNNNKRFLSGESNAEFLREHKKSVVQEVETFFHI